LRAAAAAEAPTPAALPVPGGSALVRAIEEGSQLVLGSIHEPRALDAHGWAARLQVEQALQGPARPGQSLEIGWEELARGRPTRFAEGSARGAAAELPLAPALPDGGCPRGGR
jgi:hypothetical protein